MKQETCDLDTHMIIKIITVNIEFELLLAF